MFLTLSYGDPQPATRDAIGARLSTILNCFAGTTIHCDQFTGFGEWEGVVEYSGVILAEVDPAAIPHIRASVAECARKYGQDAIGFMVGTSELVEAAV